MADTTPAGAVVTTATGSKPWYLSKTIWANVVMLAASIAALLVNEPWLPPKAVAIISGTAIPVLNLVLRLLTDQAVTVTAPPK